MAPTMMCKCRSSSDDLLLLLGRQLLAVRSIVSTSLMLEVFCHRVLRLCHAAAQGAVAQQQSSQLATPALSSWPCLSYSMLMDGVGPVADHCTIILNLLATPYPPLWILRSAPFSRAPAWHHRTARLISACVQATVIARSGVATDPKIRN